MSIAGHVSRAMLSRYSHVRMEAKRRALDEIAERQRAAHEKRKGEAQRWWSSNRLATQDTTLPLGSSASARLSRSVVKYDPMVNTPTPPRHAPSWSTVNGPQGWAGDAIMSVPPFLDPEKRLTHVPPFSEHQPGCRASL